MKEPDLFVPKQEFVVLYGSLVSAEHAIRAKHLEMVFKNPATFLDDLAVLLDFWAMQGKTPVLLRTTLQTIPYPIAVSADGSAPRLYQ